MKTNDLPGNHETLKLHMTAAETREIAALDRAIIQAPHQWHRRTVLVGSVGAVLVAVIIASSLAMNSQTSFYVALGVSVAIALVGATVWYRESSAIIRTARSRRDELMQEIGNRVAKRSAPRSGDRETPSGTVSAREAYVQSIGYPDLATYEANKPG